METKFKCTLKDKKMLKKLNDRDLWHLIQTPKRNLKEEGKRCKKEIWKEFIRRDIKLKPVMN